MKAAYWDEDTRSIIDMLPPGELFPGWTLARVSVLPPFRGRGIARKLMNEVLADADAEGLRLYLEVAPDRSNTGLSFDLLWQFYSRCGFQQSKWGYPSMVRLPKEEE